MFVGSASSHASRWWKKICASLLSPRTLCSSLNPKTENSLAGTPAEVGDTLGDLLQRNLIRGTLPRRLPRDLLLLLLDYARSFGR
jgi:hypothetical protein